MTQVQEENHSKEEGEGMREMKISSNIHIVNIDGEEAG